MKIYKYNIVSAVVCNGVNVVPYTQMLMLGFDVVSYAYDKDRIHCTFCTRNEVFGVPEYIAMCGDA